MVVDLKTGKYLPTGPAVLDAPPARALPARRRPRRRRRGRRPTGRAPAAPSWSSSASATRCPRSRPQPPQPDGDGPRLVEEQLMRAAAARARRGVRGPARRRTASAARSRRSAPTRPPGRCSRDPHPRHPRAARATSSARAGRSAPQQFAAITAPLEPAVVIAGAGSGKTTVMAARVVWLVATGRVAPGEILGLTFTTKATAELPTRIRESLRKAGLLPERGQPGSATTRRRSRSRRSRRTTPTPRRCSPSTACGSATSPTPG